MADMFSDSPAWMGSPLGWIGNTQGAARFQEGFQFGAQLALRKQEMQLREQAQVAQMAEQGLRMQALQQKMREDLESSLETAELFKQTGGDPWKVLNTMPSSGNPQTIQNWTRAQGLAANTAVAHSAMTEINQFKVDVEKLPDRVLAAQIRAMPVGPDGRPSSAQLQALQEAQIKQQEKEIINRAKLKQMAEGYSSKGMRPSMKFDEEGNVTMTVEPPLASTVNQPADIRIVSAIQEAEAKASEAEAVGNSQQASYWRNQADLIKRTQPRMSELTGVAKERAASLRSRISAIYKAIPNAAKSEIPGLQKEAETLQAQLEELVGKANARPFQPPPGWELTSPGSEWMKPILPPVAPSGQPRYRFENGKLIQVQ